MVGVLRVGRWASPQLPFSSPPPSLSAHHRGSSPTTTLTSGAGQSTSTGKNPAAGEAPVLSLHPCSVPHLHPFLGSSACHPAPSPHSYTPPSYGPQTSSLLLLTPSSPASFHSSGRSPGGGLPAGVWPCSAQSPCTGGLQTPSSTESRSCLVRSPGGKQQGREASWGGGNIGCRLQDRVLHCKMTGIYWA